ncbi:MAG TPA: amidohydrolase [Verrucomicrobiae bacterium]|nr:amidohydrolase [Verrucomicrobiae bacterium]
MKFSLAASLFFCVAPVLGEVPEVVTTAISADIPRLESFYKDLHRNPELSLLEEKTSARVAKELREAGYEVTERVGGFGVVAVLRNGPGPVVLLRTDLDALPVKEQTGLPYASQRSQVNSAGQEVPVMHACGHDMHMTVLVGTARFLAQHTNLFSGTVVAIGQPAEEKVMGAKAMLKDGLFERFPKPNYCLALHVNSDLAAGKVAYVPGFILANVDSVDITIRGVGGHGAYPHTTKDPIVLAAETVLALQTLISREKPATEPGVLTVGSIHGGTKHNIIPDEVKLQLTLRSYSDSVSSNLIAGIKRVTRGLAEAAGLPEDRMPIVTVDENEHTPATYNDPALTQRLALVLQDWLGRDAVVQEHAQMGAEDFGLFGRTPDKIPICMLWLGSVPSERMNSGQKLPSIHSALYYPDPEPTIKTGVTVLTAAMLDLLKK